ncbi:unnamed protein product [Strongylus vulgaris]|uniref:G-patch domain-containing protein n=1 Tax=Strongylus vulgaris TaxID=40348 RepID=A0A3P7JDB1_STRVU|nr:unnamed protein product [Strongylus vulgaris]
MSTTAAAHCLQLCFPQGSIKKDRPGVLDNNDCLKYFVWYWQIALIDQQLSEVTEDEKRAPLLEMRSDLLELVQLLMEQAEEGGSAEDGSQDSPTADSENFGMFYSLSHGEVVPLAHLNEYKDPDFNHGEIVPLADLNEYKDPDFNSLTVGSLVLVSVNAPTPLWEVGRLIAMDKDDIAVRVLKSNVEVSSKLDQIVALEGDVEDVTEMSSHLKSKEADTLDENSGREYWNEQKGQRCGNVTVGDLGNWHGGGFGLKLMQKMGYKLGEGLGKNSDGIVHAIQAKIVPKNSSVDACMTAKTKVVDGIQRMKSRVREGMKQTHNSVDVDIFTFLNRKLEQPPAKTEQEELKEERRKLAKSSSKSLGAQGLDLESELKHLKSKEKKLLEVSFVSF